MSGSYWTSTQRSKWQYTKQTLARERAQLWNMECQMYPNGLTIMMDTRKNNNDSNNNSNNNNNNSINDNSNDTNGNNSSKHGKNVISKNIPITNKDLHWSKDYNLRIYNYFLIMKLGRRLNIRQCALATAQIYMARFLLRVSVREVNLYLLVTTSIYLACKVEECPQYIRTLVSEARSLWPEFIPPDPTKVTEFEFYLIEELGSYLVIHHPYNSLEQIINVLKKKPYNLKISSDDIQNCWSIINDSYIINEIHLLYSPHVIAVSCLFITICKSNINNIQDDDINKIKQKIFNRFLAESQINLDEVMDTIHQIVSLYEHWENYHEIWIKFLLHTLYLKGNSTNI